MNPLVSVIVPTFNRSQFLPRTLDSIRRQSHSPIELLLIDDHSSEDLSAIYSSYSLEHLKTQGKGVSAARNTGIRKARGEYLAFLDSDDEWLPEKVARQVSYLLENPNILLVHSNEEWRRNEAVVRQLPKHKKYGGRIFEKCLELCNIGASCTMVRRSLFEKYGYFDESFPTCEDYDFWLRISSQEEIGFLEDTLTIKHGGHGDQLSLQYHSMDLWRVRALMKHVNSPHLSHKEYESLISTIKEKAQILLLGARKHANTELENEVLAYLHKI